MQAPDQTPTAPLDPTAPLSRFEWALLVQVGSGTVTTLNVQGGGSFHTSLIRRGLVAIAADDAGNVKQYRLTHAGQQLLADVTSA